jgi:hypothetical protein
MRHSTPLCLLAAVTAFAVADLAAAGQFTTVSIADLANGRLQDGNTAYPSGPAVLLGGVPFDIPSVGNNYFATSAGAGTVTLTVPIGSAGVAGVHTLINTFWGENVRGTFASLTFTFDDGSSFVKPLDGNVDVRDFYQNVFTNVINGTTTVNVFTTDNDGSAGPAPYRLDKQFIDLSAFADRTLVSMTLTDTGSNGFQRTFLVGVTVEALACVPADLNCDGVVDSSDLTILLAGWGGLGGDIDGNGTTDSTDLTILLAAWG